MKYALVLGLVLVVYWLWRSNRQKNVTEKKQSPSHGKPNTLGKTTDVVACQLCRVHLPQHEALVGQRGFYCSAEHRQQAGD